MESNGNGNNNEMEWNWDGMRMELNGVEWVGGLGEGSSTY